MSTPIPSNQTPFTLDELVRVTGGTPVNTHVDNYRGVSTDTRGLVPGSVFVALRGERFDAHDFVEAAHGAGATLAIVEREVPVPIGQLLVSDALAALGQIASYHRQRWGGEVIAIAGAAGKTTTRFATSALLEGLFGAAVHSTTGNLNNQVGVPMVLLALTDQHHYAVIEVGTNRTGEVPLLTSVVQPEVAILTLVDLEHSEGLGDLDAIEEEEGAIFGESCHTFVVNGDDPRALRQAEQRKTLRAGGASPVKVVSYGFGPEVALRAVSRRTSGTSGAELRVAEDHRVFSLHVPLVGKPACYAVLAAIGAVEALVRRPLSESEIQMGLERPTLKPEGRAELVSAPNGVLIVDDSYNANPASMRSAVVTASELALEREGRLHLVLGEMRELGAMSTEAHSELGRFVVGHFWVSLFAIGDQMAPLVDVARQSPPEDALIEHRRGTAGVAQLLGTRLRPNDVLLVKGSRGVRTEAVIAELLSEKNL